MPKQPKCRICKEPFNRTYTTIQPVCGVKCAIIHANQKQAKSAKKAHSAAKKADAARKRDFYANDTKTRKREAKAACHKYIRLRDLGNKCICCNRPLGPKYDAGHWLESGNNPLIRYDEDNIHAQSVYCNQYKGGDSDDYEGNLRLKIGNERVDRLKSMKGGTMKRTAQDYKAIEDYYKAKIKLLEDV